MVTQEADFNQFLCGQHCKINLTLDSLLFSFVVRLAAT